MYVLITLVQCVKSDIKSNSINQPFSFENKQKVPETIHRMRKINKFDLNVNILEINCKFG